MLRRWLEQQGRSNVLMIPKTSAVEYQGSREHAEQLGARLPEEAWNSLSAAAPRRTVGRHQWACLTLTSMGGRGMGRWLLVRRTVADPSDCAYYLAYAPTKTPVLATTLNRTSETCTLLFYVNYNAAHGTRSWPHGIG